MKNDQQTGGKHTLLKTHNKSPHQKQKAIQILTPAILLCTIIFAFLGRGRMVDAYANAEQSTYTAFYKTAYDIAEARNHVSNYVVISVDGAHEVSRLEVLTVNGSEFVIKKADEKDKTTSWIKVQGTGVFTVDLSAGEFITDSQRHHVLVRVPKPMLTECKISGTGKHFFKNGRMLSNGSVADGVRLSQEQMSEGRLKLEDSMKQSRIFHEEAQNGAIRAIESLVQQWNPTIPDLQVTVEFIENS